jgi:hypothetical protein
MTMSTLLAAGTSEVLVTYSAIRLFTGGGSGPGDDFSTAEPDNDLFAATPAGLMLLSAGNDHTARVRVEVWDGPPDQGSTGDQADAASQDTATGIATTTLGEGPITLAGMDTGFVEEVIPTTPYTGPAHVRVTCHGRAEAARRRYRNGELFFAGAERWVLQFWPATEPGERPDR